jgi:glutathione S-transferase
VLIPAEPLSKGSVLWFEEYADSELAGAVGRGIFQPVVLARLFGREPDVAKAKETVANVLPKFFDYLDRELGDNEYYVDDRLTLADISVATSFVNMAHAGFEPDAKKWPRLAGFVKRMLARDSFAACIEDERKFLGG